VEELAFTITNMSAIWGVAGEIAASLRAMRAATAGLDQDRRLFWAVEPVLQQRGSMEPRFAPLTGNLGRKGH